MPVLKKRRDLLKEDALFAAALGEVATTGITKRANELVDEHLTKVVLDQYDAERKGFEVAHLKVGMERRSGKTSASFQTNPGTAMTKFASEKGDIYIVHRLLAEAGDNPAPELVQLLLPAIDKAMGTFHPLQGTLRAFALRLRGQCLEAIAEPAKALAAYDEALPPARGGLRSPRSGSF